MKTLRKKDSPGSADEIVGIVRETIRGFDLQSERQPILAALSGGPDSVAMFHILIEIGVPVEAAHFDHQTRAGQSAADAEFVSRLCASLGKAIHVGTAPVAEDAAGSGQSFEAAARDARYDYFTALARERGCAAVATGHHADDQAETILMRMLRGTSARGLAGIAPKTTRDGVAVIRPLFRLDSETIHAYLHERGYEYRTDASNADTRIVRNRIRHELLPQLAKDYNVNVRDALCRLGDILRSEHELLASLTEEFLAGCLRDETTIDRAAFRAGHEALQRRALLELAWGHGADPDFIRIDGAVSFIANGAMGKFFDLGGGVQLCNGRDASTLETCVARRPKDEAVALGIPGETLAFGKRFTVLEMKKPPPVDLREYCTPARQVFDGGSFDGPAVLRRCKSGDRFTPLGMEGRKSIAAYLSERGVPAARRNDQILLAAGDEILWVVGHAISARSAVTSESRSVFEIRVRDETR